MGSFFKFRACNIHYKDEGNGRAIVLIHGFLGSMSLWDEQLKDLKSKYRVVRVDLPGHGSSESLGYMHSMELLAEMIDALRKHLNLRKIDVVGHSLGGYVALAYAEYFTDRVRSLALINSTASTDSKERKKSRKQMIELLPKKRKAVIKQLVESFFVIQAFKRRYWLKKYQGWANQTDLKGVVATIRGMMERKEREIILQFAPYPYLIIAGIEDPIISLDQNKSESKLGKGRLVVIEGSGHISPLEKAHKVNRELISFLRESIN